MTNLTVNDLNALTQLTISIIFISFFIGIFFVGYVYRFYKKIIRSINFPNRVKTENGYLYRSLNGTYVSKQRSEEIFIQRKFKRLNSSIAFHNRILTRLYAERVSTSESGNQNNETSSL